MRVPRKGHLKERKPKKHTQKLLDFREMRKERQKIQEGTEEREKPEDGVSKREESGTSSATQDQAARSYPGGAHSLTCFREYLPNIYRVTKILFLV